MKESLLITAIAIALIVVGIIYKVVARKTKQVQRQKERIDDDN